jgi:hypothetical protein
MTTTKKATKPVSVIARCEFKADTRKVIYLVSQSSGEGQYETHMFDGKACSCTCASRRPCKHMAHCEQLEAKRVVVSVGNQAVSGCNAKHAIEKAIRLVKANAEKSRQDEKLSKDVQSTVKSEAKGVTCLSDTLAKVLEVPSNIGASALIAQMAQAPLHGNRGFSLMR